MPQISLMSRTTHSEKTLVAQGFAARWAFRLCTTVNASGLFSEPLVNLMQTFADQAVIAIENARMFHVTREALEHQTASAEVLRVVSDSVADARPVFEKVVESCERLLSASHVILLLLRDDEHLVRVAHNGELNSEIDGLPREFPLAGSATERAIRERQTAHCP